MAYLSVAHLSKSYGEVRAVVDFSLEVQKGETFALVGPDGAGKTTVIRALCNLVDPDSGSATVDGIDIFKQFDRIKLRLGYMPQTFSLYPDLSVEENLIFYGGIYGVTGEAFRTRRDRLYGFSNLEPFASRRAGELSGGMKQKLALSCALIHDPDLLVLDEPTTGVDPLSRRQFWEILTALKAQGVTIVVTTPYMDEVERADRACFMFGGHKLAEGEPQELTSSFAGNVYFLDVEPSTEVVDRIDRTRLARAQRFGAGLHLYTSREIPFEAISARLSAAGIDTSRLRQVEPSLEDAFIQFMESAS